MSIRKTGPGADIVPIRPTAKMYVTVWNLPELTWARSAVGIDVVPGAIARGDYSGIVAGLKAIQLISPREFGEVTVIRNTSDTELFDVMVDGVPYFRVAPSGSGFSRVEV